MTKRLILLILLAAVGSQVNQGYTQPTSQGGLRLTLARQAPWQEPDGWCRFGIEAVPSGAGMSLQCGPGTALTPPAPGLGSGVRRRALTEPETVTLRRLYEAADLFDNGHIGADWSASDLGVEMLIVRDDGRAVALMTFGNRTFASGPRRALLDWLRQQQVELQAAVISKE